jgi:hypothetical protein
MHTHEVVMEKETKADRVLADGKSRGPRTSDRQGDPSGGLPCSVHQAEEMDPEKAGGVELVREIQSRL